MSEQAEMEVANELVDTASITDGKAVVAFNRTEAALADLRARFKGATFDLTSTKGDTAARQARKELVTLRTGLDRKRKELKAPATEFSRKIDAEAARLTVEIAALEDPIDAQIKADERRREEERAERERIEAERVEAHRQRISEFAAVALRAIGLSSAEIDQKIELVTRQQIGDDFQEFMAAAVNEKATTILRLQELHTAAVEREEREAQAERNQKRLAELEADNDARLKREAAEKSEREAHERKVREAAELAAAIRAEQGRVVDALIAELRWIERRGMFCSAAGMLELVTAVEAIAIGPELGDFAGLAEKTRDDTRASLHEMHADKVRAEAEKEASDKRLREALAETERLEKLAEARRAELAALAPPPAAPLQEYLGVSAEQLAAGAAEGIEMLREAGEPVPDTYPQVATPEGDRGPAWTGGESAGHLTVPVTRNFDSADVIGELSIRTDALPETPDFVFSLGYMAHHFTEGAVDKYELVTVSLLHDDKYIGHLQQIGKLPPTKATRGKKA